MAAAAVTAVKAARPRSRSGRAGPATEAKTFTKLVNEYEKQNPGDKISSLYVDNDDTLQKVTTAVRGGSPPDIAYLYGSWAPNVATIPQVVNLTQVVKKAGVNWNDFYVGERDVATVNGKVIGIPALVDNLAVVYNKKLFAAAGLQPPSANWTWDDFVADAQKLTDASKKQYGTAYVTPGTEDTVWHWEALLWEAGGQILNAGNNKAAFNSPAGLTSLNTLKTMAVTNKSMYFDPTDQAYENVFNSGKIGMLVTGPWDLSTFPNVQYGVQVMPTYPGSRRRPPDHLRPGQLGGVQQRLGQDRGGREVPALADRTGPGQDLVAGHRRPAHPDLGGQHPRVRAQDERHPARGEHVHRQPEQRQAGPAPDHPVPEDLHGPGQHGPVRAAEQEHAAGRPEVGRAAGQPGPGRELTWRFPSSRRGARSSRGTGPAAPVHRRILSSEHLTGWAFVTPGAAIILLFGAVPIVWSAVMSFQNSHLQGGPSPFVGLKNYRQMVHDPVVGQAIGHTLIYTVLFVPGTMIVGLFLAVAMNRKIRFISLYRTAAYATMAISTISEAIVFIWLFDPSYGIVNYIFSLVGVPQQQFLNNPSEALYVIVAMTIWGWTGFAVIIYLAALQGVPTTLLEAAALDGAGRGRRSAR